ncbi:WD40 repeat domain-containing serine/threonine protein kinase [Streptomyces mirabilis]|uniref:WD40 repeat domain-containing serine/threonine protein kinase n=1 Tax=Streptomyces mirabilis TaxID=68239 RepID=UPI00331EF42B
MSAGTGSPLWEEGHVIDGLYEVVQLAGKGGMSLVYQVTHLQWGIDLALKRLRSERLSDSTDPYSSGQREQFVAEAEAWVSLGLHPNICGCHYVRQLDDELMVFAEYITGGSLHRWIADRALYQGSAAEAALRVLDVAIQFAWGLQHAHSRGLVHQDVKPANVLLDLSGGDITVKVTDFGLARARSGVPLAAAGSAGNTPPDASLLVSRAGLTPAYASPEQAAGKALSRRTDVYSYAVSVLEMFTGERMWRTGSKAGQALAPYLAGRPTKPGLPAMPPGLAELLARCLNEDPVRRPASMAAIAADIAEIYRRESGSAYTRALPSAAELRADELANRGTSLLDLDRTTEAKETFAAALKADPQHLTATYNAGLLRWRHGAITDDDLLAEIQQAARQPASDPWRAACLSAHVHLERGDLESARKIADSLKAERHAEPEVQTVLRALKSGRVGHTAAGHTTPVPWYEDQDSAYGRMPFRFSRDGAHAVTWGNGTVRRWDVQRGVNRGINCRGGTHVDVSADGRLGIVGGGNHAEVWNFTDGNLVREFWVNQNPLPGSSQVEALRLAPNGRRAFASTSHGEVFAWDLQPGGLQARWDFNEDVAPGAGDIKFDMKYFTFEVNADGSQLLAATGSEGRGYRISHLDLARTRHRVLAELGSRVRAMALTADGTKAVTAGDDNQIRVWHLDSGKCEQQIASTASIESLAISSDARWALTAGLDAVRLWDLTVGRCLRTFEYSGYVAGVWLSPDGRSGRSAGHDNTIRTFSFQLPVGYQAPMQLSRPRQSAELSRLNGEVRELVDEAEQSITASGYAIAQELLTRARAVPGHEQDPRVLRAWRELGQHVPRTRLRGAWRAATLSVDRSDSHHSVSVAANGRIAASGYDSGLRLWDLQSGTLLHKFPVQLVQAAVGMSTDGQQVVCASFGRVHVWSVDTGAELFLLDCEDRRYFRAPSMSPDGRRVLFGAHGDLRLWDIATGKRLQTLCAHRLPIYKTLISTDGRVGVSAAADSIRLWDLDSGECRLKIFINDLQPLCMSPVDGLLVAKLGKRSWTQPNPQIRTESTSDADWRGRDRPGIRMWNAAGECVREFETGPGDVTCAEFSPDERFIFAGADSGKITVWDVGNGELLQTLEGHQQSVTDIRITPDGRYALSGDRDGTLRLWELDWELCSDTDHT